VQRLRPQIPAEVSALVDRLLEKEPNARPRDAREAVSLLEEALSGLPLRPSAGAMPRSAPEQPSEEATFFAGPPPRAVSTEPSSATLPRGRHGVLRMAAAFAGGLLLALVLAWQGRHLAAPTPAPSTYELYERGLAALRRYDRAGNLGKAIADFREVIGRAPDHAAAHAALARACQLQFVNQKDRMWLDQGLPLAERAVALDGYLASARVSLAQVYTSLGRLDEAAREIEKAIQIEPDNADAQYALGLLSEARGQLDPAETAYRRRALPAHGPPRSGRRRLPEQHPPGSRRPAGLPQSGNGLLSPGRSGPGCRAVSKSA
jgi:tetratricopeptide (TPR) repeat protein